MNTLQPPTDNNNVQSVTQPTTPLMCTIHLTAEIDAGLGLDVILEELSNIQPECISDLLDFAAIVIEVA